MRRAADLYADAAKTDPKAVLVLADYARGASCQAVMGWYSGPVRGS